MKFIDHLLVASTLPVGVIVPKVDDHHQLVAHSTPVLLIDTVPDVKPGTVAQQTSNEDGIAGRTGKHF
jgi:hypothetical protein